MSDSVRLEALKLAVQLCGHGNWENIARRSDGALFVADLFVAWLGEPPRREAAADAIDATTVAQHTQQRS